MTGVNVPKFGTSSEAHSLGGFATCGKYYIHKQASSMHTVQPHRKTAGLIFLITFM